VGPAIEGGVAPTVAVEVRAGQKLGELFEADRVVLVAAWAMAIDSPACAAVEAVRVVVVALGRMSVVTVSDEPVVPASPE
jgi:hypothetical protein